MQYHRYRDDSSITCLLCAHYCTLKEGRGGVCGVNVNEGGVLKNLVHSHPSAIHLDPIEKKPLYHFLPATTSLSIGTVGCNFRCPFCQNHTISQTSQVDEANYYPPEVVVELALKLGAKSISYTYNEPTIWYPYAKDIGTLAKQKGLKNVFVTSGFESSEVLEDMPIWVDALNVDLKSFNEAYYKKVLKTSLHVVLKNLKNIAQSGMHLELTTLLIPGVNDSTEEIAQMVAFVKDELGYEIPYHFSAFHPDYKMLDTPPTPEATLMMAKDMAKKEGLEYIYLGNIRFDNSTYCPKCGELLIQRDGYNTTLKSSTCSRCGYRLKGVFQ